MLPCAFLCSSIFFFSCNKEVKKDEAANETPQDSVAKEEKWDIPREVDNRPLNVRLDALSDSINRSINEAIENDNQKFNAVKAVLENSKLIKGFKHTEEVMKLKKIAEEAEKLRYTRQSISAGESIVAYDKKTEEMLNLLKAIYESSNQFDGNLSASRAAAEAISRDQDDFFYRKNYAKFVREYNELLEKNASEIQKLDEKYRNLKPEKDFVYIEAV
jgi:hypothetical protein